MTTTTTPVRPDPAVRRAPDGMLRQRLLRWALDYGLYVTLAVLVIYFSLASPFFFTPRNLVNIAIAISVIGILAAGFTFALIAGQVDISIGATLGLTAVVVAMLNERVGLPWYAAALISLSVGLVIGLVNGMLVTVFALNSLIVTLAMSIVIRGVALITAGGQTIPMSRDKGLQEFVNSRPAGVPVPVIALVITFVVAWVVLSRMRFGWHVYAVGANPSAASRAGISTSRVYLSTFVVSGMLAGVGGLISAGQASGGGPTFGDGIEFQVLAAVLLAGFGLQGGSGRIQQALVGVLVVGVLLNGLTLIGVDAYYQYLSRGIVFLAAVLLASLAMRRSLR